MDKDTNVKEKIKSPGRVAWGKKLSEIKKQARLDKLSNLSEDIKNKQVTETKTNEPDRSSNIIIWVTAGSLVIGLLALYYQRKTAVLAESQTTPAKEIVVSAGSKCLKMQ